MDKKASKSILTTKSPFAYTVVLGIIMGIASIHIVLTDIMWLIGDMSHSRQWYHSYILINLIVGLFEILLSFFWLFKAANKYMKKHLKIMDEQAKMIEALQKQCDHLDYSRKNNFSGNNNGENKTRCRFTDDWHYEAVDE